jgi:hypothetical protein
LTPSRLQTRPRLYRKRVGSGAQRRHWPQTVAQPQAPCREFALSSPRSRCCHQGNPPRVGNEPAKSEFHPRRPCAPQGLCVSACVLRSAPHFANCRLLTYYHSQLCGP